MTNLHKQFLAVSLVIVLLAGCIPSTPVVTPGPADSGVKGAPGMGDPYYPNLGNGGYDVQNYTITMEVNPADNTVSASTTITANAIESLSSFNLDFHGLTVDSITVNDMEAEYSRSGGELTILPASPLEANKLFTTVVKYHGTPETVTSGGLSGMGWAQADSGAINVWGEPDAATAWFPNNNHPRDKAMYLFEITVPDPWMVAATGTLKETRKNGTGTTYIWEMDKPMATYLASINIDQYDLATRDGPHGIKIRNYFPKNLDASYRSKFNTLPEMIDFLEGYFGPYPFAEYGVVVAAEDGLCTDTPLALETQTLSLHCPTESMTSQFTTVHEIAHMWFGDSVSLENWKDIWLKEGFATYASWLWGAKGDPATLAGIAQGARNHFSDTDASVAEPKPADLYTNESYTGGALALYALQKEVGDQTFFKILQTYAERYKYSNAGTDEFISVAEEVSEKDLTSFFDAWLFSPTMPDLPE